MINRVGDVRLAFGQNAYLNMRENNIGYVKTAVRICAESELSFSFIAIHQAHPVYPQRTKYFLGLAAFTLSRHSQPLSVLCI